jgi:hypothetical protein
MHAQQPVIGSWYRDRQSGATFEVVAIDDASQSIDVQMLEGELCEYDLDSWRQLDLEAAEEPDDWHYAVDQQEDGDRLTTVSWDNPLDLIEPDVATDLFDEEP